ncbi:hypothetical protein ACHAXT_008543 [Thalassiosira profunda]
MGQAASRAVGAAERFAPRAASRASQAAQTKAAAEAEWRRRTEAPYSPDRGKRHQAETDAAIAAAEARASGRGDDDQPAAGGGAGGEGGSAPELPPDLIQFLNDAGPLQRTVDKDLTSEKVYDSLVRDEDARIAQNKEANTRVRRRMPIVSARGDAPSDALDVHDGSTTERTTNFSTRERSAPARLGVTREDLFRLPHKLRGIDADGPEWKKRTETEYEAMAKNGSKSKDFDQLQDAALFENSLRYIGMPVLMKDAEGDVLGVWQRKADAMKHSVGVKVAREGSLRFVMETEGGAAKDP